jgi:ABC-type transport system involved in multi-copper enzyme maturation permease subunit
LPLASLSNSVGVLVAQLTGVVMESNGSVSVAHLSGPLTGLLGIVPALVVAVYLVVPMAVAAFLFRRRDMLGIG